MVPKHTWEIFLILIYLNCLISFLFDAPLSVLNSLRSNTRTFSGIPNHIENDHSKHMNHLTTSCWCSYPTTYIIWIRSSISPALGVFWFNGRLIVSPCSTICTEAIYPFNVPKGPSWINFWIQLWYALILYAINTIC